VGIANARDIAKLFFITRSSSAYECSSRPALASGSETQMEWRARAQTLTTIAHTRVPSRNRHSHTAPRTTDTAVRQCSTPPPTATSRKPRTRTPACGVWSCALECVYLREVRRQEKSIVEQKRCSAGTRTVTMNNHDDTTTQTRSHTHAPVRQQCIALHFAESHTARGTSASSPHAHTHSRARNRTTRHHAQTERHSAHPPCFLRPLTGWCVNGCIVPVERTCARTRGETDDNTHTTRTWYLSLTMCRRRW
jgi:hypothetical protein